MLTRDGVRQIDALTGIRAVAALWVMIFHFREYKVKQVFPLGPAEPFMARGELGVDLFFVLSGFIMMHVYRDSFRQTVHLKDVSGFLLFRMARLYPVHLFTLSTMLALAALSAALGMRGPLHPEVYSATTVATNLLLVNTWFGIGTPNWPAWSISAEWFAYLLFPALCYLIQRHRFVPVLYCAISLVVLPYMLISIIPDALERVTADFMIGMSAYLLFSEKIRMPAVTGVAAAAALVVLIHFTTDIRPIYAALMALLIAALAQPQDLLGRALSRPTMVYLGEISYSIYMVHWPVRVVVREMLNLLAVDFHPLMFIATYSIATLLVASATYHFVEIPGRRLIRQLSSRSVPAASPRGNAGRKTSV